MLGRKEEEKVVLSTVGAIREITRSHLDPKLPSGTPSPPEKTPNNLT